MDPQRRRGLILVFIGGVLYSTAGLFTHALPYDAWTVSAWRAVFGALFCLLWMLAADGLGAWRSFLFDRAQAATLPFITVSGFCFIFALKLTTVADVMVVYATLPFVAAGVSWLWGREIPTKRLMVASLMALGGVAVMMAGAFGAGSTGRLAGIGFTFLMNLCYALTLVGARRSSRAALAPFTAGTALCALLCFALAPREVPSLPGLAVLGVFGVTTIGLAMALFITGARSIPAAEVGLVGLTDVVIGPLLVWIGFGETPGLGALCGGAVVIAAVLWHLWPDLRRARRRLADMPGRRASP